MFNKSRLKFNQIFNILSKNEKKQVIVIFILSFIGIFLDLFGIGMIFPILEIITSDGDTFLSKFEITDQFFKYKDKNATILIVISFFLVFFLLKTIFSTFLIWYEKRFVYLTTYKLGSKLLSQYLRENILDLINKKQSEIVRNILVEAGLFITGIIFNILKLILEFILVAGIAIIIIYFDPFSSIISLSIVASFVVIYIFVFKKKLKRFGAERQTILADLIKTLNDGFVMHKEIRLLNKSDFLHENYNKHALKAAKIGIFEQVVNSLPKIYFELFAVMGFSIIVYFYVIIKSDVDSALPIMGLYAAAVFRILPSANRIITSFNSLIHNMPAFSIMYQELKNINQVKPNKEIEVNDYTYPVLTNVELRKLSFKYKTQTKEKIILDKANFQIKKGVVTGLIGDSGSGKSTIANLISGLIDEYRGDIVINNQIFNDRTLKYKVGYVPQITNLIDDSLLNNICFGIKHENIDRLKLNKIIKKINLEPLINNLPNGIDSNIGEQGLTLSGGQRQRIALARTLYLESEIIIFDESTSSLDKKSEKDFVQNILELKDEKIILFISHDKNLEQYFDVIYKIQNNNLEIIKS